MWQVGIVFAALASFSGAAGDALVRLSFVLEAKRRRQQRQLLLLRELQRSATAAPSCRFAGNTSGGFSSSYPDCNSLSSSECESGSGAEEEKELPESRAHSPGKGEKDETSYCAGDHVKDTEICTYVFSNPATRSYEIRKEEAESCFSDSVAAVNKRLDAEEEGQQIVVPSRPFYLRPLWLLGTCLGTIINSLLSIISLDFASAAVVTPFAGLHIFWNVIFSRFILQERVFTQHYVGSALVLFGLFFVLCYGVHTPPTLSLQQLLRLYSQNSCVIYFCFSTFTLIPCVYIGLFGKDIAPQHQRGQQREQRQQQGQSVRQLERNRALPYNAVGEENFSGSLDADKNGAGRSSSCREWDSQKVGAVSAAGIGRVVHCRRRNSPARVKRVARHGRVLPLVERDEEEEPGGLSGRLCEALPQAEKSFSSFSCDDDESLSSASDGDGWAQREILHIAATDTTTGPSSSPTGHVHSPAAAAESEAQVASVDHVAPNETHSERRKVLSQHMPASDTDINADAVEVATSEIRSSYSKLHGELPAEPPCLQFAQSPIYGASQRARRAKQIDSVRDDEAGEASRPLQRREKTAVKSERQPCLHYGRSSSNRCLAFEISKVEEKMNSSGAAKTNGNSTFGVDVESGSNAEIHKRRKQQQHLNMQQHKSGTWSDMLPAALYVEVPVALRRFCIAAASGVCGGNTNIIMEHVMDVWHTESLASLLHPKFFLLLLLLGIMALGQLVFLNLGLARYEALYVMYGVAHGSVGFQLRTQVPTTMSVLIISSCLGEFSVFIHVLELSHKEFFIFAGGALSIVSGIMVLSAADMERQQESSTGERLKEEDERQSAAESNLFETLPSKAEDLCCLSLASANEHGAVLGVPLRSDRHTLPERCATTSTKCSRTHFSNREVSDTADEAAKGSSTDAKALGEIVGEAEKRALDLAGGLRLHAEVETECKLKMPEEKEERQQERSNLNSQKRLSESPDRLPARVPDSGLPPAARVSAVDSATVTDSVASAPPPLHDAAGRAAASQVLTVNRVSRSPTADLLSAAAAVPQALYSRLVRGSSRVVANSDTCRHAGGRNKLRSRSRYKRLTREGYACTVAHASEEEPCELHLPCNEEAKSFLHLGSAESSCTCQLNNVVAQRTQASTAQVADSNFSSVR